MPPDGVQNPQCAHHAERKDNMRQGPERCQMNFTLPPSFRMLSRVQPARPGLSPPRLADHERGQEICGKRQEGREQLSARAETRRLCVDLVVQYGRRREGTSI